VFGSDRHPVWSSYPQADNENDTGYCHVEGMGTHRASLVLAGVVTTALLGCGLVSRDSAARDEGHESLGGRTSGGGDGSQGGSDAKPGGNAHAGAVAANGGSGGMPEAPAMPWKSGSRLRARVWDSGDGAKLFITWRDTKLGIPCAFSKGPDGVHHCLPDSELDDSDCPIRGRDLSKYVTAVEKIDKSIQPLATRLLLGEDGSLENAGLFDVAHGLPCGPQGDEAGTCLPLHFVVANPPPGRIARDDSDCSPCPTAGFRPPEREPFAPTDLGCHGVFDTYTIVSAAGTSSSSDNACSNSVVSDHTYAKTPTKHLGTGRLRAQFFSDSAGQAVRNWRVPGENDGALMYGGPQPGFFDEDSKTACAPYRVGNDGESAVCVPLPFIPVDDLPDCVHIAFTDPACSTPAYLQDGCAVPSCGDRFLVLTTDNVYELGPMLDVRMAFYAKGPSGTCAVDTRFDGGPSLAYSLIGPAVPRSSLATISLRVE
jgi:hypothetical protein